MTTSASRRAFLQASVGLATAGFARSALGRQPPVPPEESIPVRATLPRYRDPFFDVKTLEPDFAGKTPMEWEKGRLRVLSGEGGNTLLALAVDAVLVVDSKNAPCGGLIRGDIAACNPDWPMPPQSFVVNTHHHADHTGGNHAFTADSTILAHPKAFERIRSQTDRYRATATDFLKRATADTNPRREILAPYAELLAEEMALWTPQTFVPTRALQGKKETVWVGLGRDGETTGAIEVELEHFAQGHTDNDVVVRLPRYNVLHVGDLCFNRCFPYIDRAGGANTWHWQWVLRQIIERCDEKTIVVPGHGEVTDVEGLRRQTAFFDTVRARVQEWVKERKTREEVAAMEIDEFKEYQLQWIRPITLGAIFDEVTSAPVGGGK